MSKVYLVGAGPGDPELLTLKGRRVLEAAGVVVYDHLAPKELLDLAPAGAERIYAGKKRTQHQLSQEEICSILIERARRGQTVVRLKGGDPFIFGRGGEEAEALVDAGVEFEVVPGVTTPLGIAAYCGVPLTHRQHSSMVTFLTGHDPEAIDWEKAAGAETLVLFMGLTTLSQAMRKLIETGRAPDTPAMAVRWATRADQQVIAGTVGDLAARIAGAGMKPPATVVVGEVVRLRGKLSWFEKLPLFGQRVIVTRAQEQAGDFSARLRTLGAAVVEMPTIAIHPARDSGPLDGAIGKLNEYDWLLFTSANGVRFFLERLDASATDLRALRARICAIGPATAAAVRRLHLKVDLMPEQYVAESLVAAFAATDLAGRRVLLPRAAVARDVIPGQLRQRGATVDVVEAYRNVAAEVSPERVREIFAGEPDWITFTSSSTVNNFVAIAGKEVLQGVRVASIGPVTTAAARKHGIAVTAEASRYTIDGLVEAMVEARQDSL